MLCANYFPCIYCIIKHDWMTHASLFSKSKIFKYLWKICYKFSLRNVGFLYVCYDAEIDTFEALMDCNAIINMMRGIVKKQQTFSPGVSSSNQLMIEK